MRKLLTESDGRQLAIKMLRKMEKYETAPGHVNSLWPWSMQAMYRPKNTQQDNVLLRYLEKIQGNGKALAGFCSVITDHLGQVGAGPGAMHLWVYEKLTERDLTGAPGPWPRMDDDDRPAA